MSRGKAEAGKPAVRSNGGSSASMRLDKYLKVSRLIKRRSVANDACDTSHVSVNGKEAKPGTEVKSGDIIAIRFGDKLTKYEVLSVNEHAMKAQASEMYRAIAE